MGIKKCIPSNVGGCTLFLLLKLTRCAKIITSIKNTVYSKYKYSKRRNRWGKQRKIKNQQSTGNKRGINMKLNKKFKKEILIKMLAMSLLVTSMPPINVFAYDSPPSSNNFTYCITKGIDSAEVIGRVEGIKIYNEANYSIYYMEYGGKVYIVNVDMYNMSDINIPSTIQGMEVAGWLTDVVDNTAVQLFARAGNDYLLNEENSERIYGDTNKDAELVTNITLPNGIKKIPDVFLYYNDGWISTGNLNAVNGPNVREVGGHAFRKQHIVSANLPNLAIIGRSAFEGTPLTTLSTNELTIIRDSGLYQCTNLTSLDLSNIQTIERSGLANCGKLNVVLPPKSITLGDYALLNVKSVTLKDDQLTGGTNVFAGTMVTYLKTDISCAELFVGAKGVYVIPNSSASNKLAAVGVNVSPLILTASNVTGITHNDITYVAGDPINPNNITINVNVNGLDASFTGSDLGVTFDPLVATKGTNSVAVYYNGNKLGDVTYSATASDTEATLEMVKELTTRVEQLTSQVTEISKELIETNKELIKYKEEIIKIQTIVGAGDMSEVIEKINELTQKIESYESKIREYEQIIKEYESQIKEYQATIEHYKELIKEATGGESEDIGDLIKKFEDLLAELENMKGQLNEAEASKEDLIKFKKDMAELVGLDKDATTDEIKEEVMKIQAELASSKQEIETYKELIKELYKNLGINGGEVGDGSTGDFTSIFEKVKEMTDRISELEKMLNEISKNLGTGDITTGETSIEEILNIINSLKQQITDMQAENNGLYEILNQIKVLLGLGTDATPGDIMSEITNIKNELVISQTTINNYKQQIEDLTNKNWSNMTEEELNAALKQLQEKYEAIINEYKAALEKANAEIDNLKTENAALKKENSSLKDENAALKKEIEQLKAKNNSTTTENNAVEKENSELKDENNTLLEQIKELKKQLALYINNTTTNENKASDLQSKLDTANTENNSLKETIDQLKAQIEKLKSTSSTSTTTVTKTQPTQSTQSTYQAIPSTETKAEPEIIQLNTVKSVELAETEVSNLYELTADDNIDYVVSDQGVEELDQTLSMTTSRTSSLKFIIVSIILLGLALVVAYFLNKKYLWFPQFVK